MEILKKYSFIMLVIFILAACKKNNPAPSSNNGGGNNNGGGGGFTSVHPFLWVKNIPSTYAGVLYSTTDATIISTAAWTQVSTTDPNNYATNPYFITGGLSNYTRTKNSACIEGRTGMDSWIFSGVHRYYYKIETGNWADGFVITHTGYVDIYSDGSMNVVPSNTNSTTVETCAGTNITFNY